MNNHAIGVFDSGIGGLTVLSELIEQFPHEDFIYVADTLHCPYGIKPQEEIADLVTRITKYLIGAHVKAIVIACNTATANSDHLKDITKLPIIGVIRPTAEYALQVSSERKIAILATNAAVDSGCYQNYLKAGSDSLYPVRCSEFVPLIEQGRTHTKEAARIIKEKLSGLESADTIILGCTHFPLIQEQIHGILPDARLVTSGKATAEALEKVLSEKDLRNEKQDSGSVILCTTGDPKHLKKQIPWFTKEYTTIQKISI